MAGDVELIEWPRDAARRRELADAGLPRLLLVTDEYPAPQCDDVIEDWIRMPAPDFDLANRLTTLRRRHDELHVDPPVVDEAGLLRWNDRWVPLSPIQVTLVSTLLASFGRVVSRARLTGVVWPGRSPGSRTLDVQITRLRKRLHEIDLDITVVHGRGYVLHEA